MAAVWAANSLAGWQIPWGVNLVLAIIFFGIAAFQTWREEHLKLKALEREPLRPIQIRKRLDDFVERGRELLAEWKSGRGLPPQTETELWDSSLGEFVERYFTVRQSDTFKGHMLTTETALEVLFEFGDNRGEEGHKAAQLIAKRVEALKKLRPEIRD